MAANPKAFARWIPFVLVLLCGVVISLKTLHEPDLWWQLRTGEYILEHGEVPDTDVFSYTFAGEPWLNVKWGFEVLMATIANWGGPETIYLLQVVATILLLVFSWKTWQQMSRNSSAPTPALIWTLLFLLFTISFRLNGRPEMTSHVMTAAYLFLYMRYRNQGGWRVLWFIPLQMVWANLHEGYGVGLVMLLVFTGSLWVEHLILEKGNKSSLLNTARFTGVAVLSWLAVAIHPSGTTMLTHLLEIYRQLGGNKFTVELYDVTNPLYWTYQAYMNITMLLLCLGLLVWRVSRLPAKDRWTALLRQYGLAYWGLYLAFFYLSLNSQRNIPFAMLAATPLLAHLLDGLLAEKRWYATPAISWGTVVLAIGFYVSICTNTFYNTFTPRDRYGMAIMVQKTPEGAARFIEQNNLQGKAFVDYLSSSYLLWRLQPEFKTYIDLRDLDIFNEKFFDNVLFSYTQPAAETQSGQSLWQFMDELDQFQYVVLLNNQNFAPLLRHILYNDPNFDLVYVDPLNTVFVRVTDANQPLLQRYGFKTANSGEIFSRLPLVQPSKKALVINKLFWPPYEPYNVATFDYQSSLATYKKMMGL